MATTGGFNVGASDLRSPLLNANEIFATIYNMIISQQVFSDNIKGTYGDLASKFKVDGTLYGDTKLFYATDALSSQAWTNYSEASNLLATKKPDDPKCQYVQIDQFRMIWLTLDNYLSKRAWSTEGAFSQFHAVMTGWMGETKRVYESRLINTFVGTTISSATKGTINVDLTTAKGSASTEEEARRLQAQEIAKDIADLLVDLKDTTRDYNEYNFLRSYDEGDFYYVFNSKYYNMITKLDLPTIFHKDGLVDKLNDNVLPAKYFGTVITSTNASTYSDSTPTTGKPIDSDNGAYTPGSTNANGCIRSLVEKDFKISTTDYHVFPGDELPAGATIGNSKNFAYGEVYIETDDVICKIIHKSAVPFMSAFETETSFFNPRSLTENKYLIWGYSNPCTLKNYPFLTVKAV